MRTSPIVLSNCCLKPRPPDGAITLTVPALKRGVFAVRNTTAHPVTVTISGQPADPPVVLPDEVQLLVCNGIDVLPAGSTQPPYDIMLFLPGTQDDGQLLLELLFVRAVAFPEDLAGSEAYAGAAPAAGAVMKLLKNDVEVGTVTFAVASQTGTFDLSGGALFEAGDRLAVTAPATADTALADVALGLKGSSCVVSIIFIEGFDYYASVANVAAASWTINSTSGATLAAGRFAGQCLRHSGNSQRLTSRSIPGTNTLTLGVAIRFEDPENVSGNHPFVAFMTAAAAAQFRIGLNPSGQVFIQLGTSTILATSAEAEPVFEAGVWYYLEVEAFVHDTTGFVRVYRDGVLLVAADNQDTRGQAGSDLVEMIRFIGNNGGGTSDGPNVWSIDDIYVIDDSTRLGQCRVSTLLPTRGRLRRLRIGEMSTWP